MKLSRLAGLVTVLLSSTLLPALAAPDQSSIPVVTTLAALRAKGPALAQYSTVYLKNWAVAGDGGGGWFYWDQNAITAENGCTVFQATNGPGGAPVAIGRLRRLLNSTPFNVDMCGTGQAGGDDSTAFNNAFAAAATLALGVNLSAKNYRFKHNISATPGVMIQGVNSSGNAGTNTILDFTNDLDGGNCFSIAGPTLGAFANGNSVGGFFITGNVNGVGLSAHCTNGMYVGRVTKENIHDIEADYFNGPAIFYGNSVLSSLSNIKIFGAGNATTAGLEIDGEKVAGTEYPGTTLTMTNIDVDSDAGNHAQACVKIDRYLTVDWRGGSAESCGTLLMVESKASGTYGASDITIQSVDFEDPTNGATAFITYCTGWTGLAGLGCQGNALIGNTLVADLETLSSLVVVKESTEFFALHNQFQTFNAGTVMFDFQGTGNAHEMLQLTTVNNVQVPYTYVQVNGTIRTDVLPSALWSVDGNQQADACQPLVGHPTAVVGVSQGSNLCLQTNFNVPLNMTNITGAFFTGQRLVLIGDGNLTLKDSSGGAGQFILGGDVLLAVNRAYEYYWNAATAAWRPSAN